MSNTLDIGTLIFYTDSKNGSHNLWHLGIPFILQHTDHHPPDFRNTWRRHLKHRNLSNFLRLQTHTIQAITNAYTLSIDSTPFGWLLVFHLDMLVLAPSIATECSHTSIHATIRDRINSIYSGNIEYVYNMAMSCRQHSLNTTPTSTGHNQTAQRAADSDQFRTAVTRATTYASVASRCGASQCGAKSKVFNLILRLFCGNCLHTTSDDDQTRRHICTNNRQTPPPWWSRSPLQRHGFDEPMPPEGWAALRMFVSMPPSKRLSRFHKFK